MNITQKGRILAEKLEPSTGYDSDIAYICSLLCRQATTYHRIQEQHCNGHPAMDNPSIPIADANRLQAKFEQLLEKQEANIENRVNMLCHSLPKVEGKHIEPIFSGDPRGAVIKLKMPDGRYDDWGHEGICI